MSQSIEQSEEDVTRHHAYGYITSHINYIQDLPSPDEGKWMTGEQSQGISNQIRNLISNGIVEQHGRVGHTTYFYYTTDEKAYQDIQYALKMLSFTPCGHTGVQNLGDGEYTCGYEFCDERFGREAAEKAVF